uniref:Pheromone Phb2.1 B1 n=1 Tax=Coprinopsis cinerea TaxID=5346 RepID=Q6TMC4_COPCI|nr:pheromone precursor Phb2.1 B1 [Coprinopsis cinerea]
MDSFTTLDNLGLFDLSLSHEAVAPETSTTPDGEDQGTPVNKERPGTGSLGAFCVMA